MGSSTIIGLATAFLAVVAAVIKLFTTRETREEQKAKALAKVEQHEAETSMDRVDAQYADAGRVSEPRP